MSQNSLFPGNIAISYVVWFAITTVLYYGYSCKEIERRVKY